MTTAHLLHTFARSPLLSAASGGGVSLDFDRSFILQMFAFALLVAILNPLLFQPLMRVFEERERRTDGAKLLARRMDEEAGQMLRRYEAEIEKVRRVASEERERMRSEAQKLEAKILAEARAETSKIIEHGKARMAEEARSIRTELQAQAPVLAREMAARVLGREIA
jgi:F-type H+-transporting ATPase subunit b